MKKMAGLAIAGAVAITLGASAMGMIGSNFGYTPTNEANKTADEGIVGTVVDADGNPVADAIVTVASEDQGEFSDECHGGGGSAGIGGGGTNGATHTGRFAWTDKHGHFRLANANNANGHQGIGTTGTGANTVIVGRKKGVGTGTTTVNGKGGNALIKLHNT